MEEADIQIRGYMLRLPLDVLVVASANPEDYTNRGRIITPLKDRFGAEVRTHYPVELDDEIAVIRQESQLTAEVPDVVMEILARFTRALRGSDAVNQRAGVSARFAIAGAETIARQIPDRRGWLATIFAVVVVIAAVPDLPRAVAPLRPVDPWPGWNTVSGLVAMDDSAVAVLPAGPYRIIDGRPTYDPAVKILPAPVLATGDLVVSGTRVGGEGTTAATVESTLLDAPDDAVEILRANGVAWVLVESSPGELGDSARVLDRLELVYSDAHLALHRVPGAIAPVDHADRTPAWIALAAWVAMALAGPVSGLVPGSRRDRTRRAPARRTPNRGTPGYPGVTA